MSRSQSPKNQNQGPPQGHQLIDYGADDEWNAQANQRAYVKKGRYQKKAPTPKNLQVPAKKRGGRKASVYKEVEVMEVSDIIPE